jgi:ABC-type lipoprotein export system ATPase subunit
MSEKLLNMPVGSLFEKHPYAGDYFRSAGLKIDKAKTTQQIIDALTPEELEDAGLTAEEIASHFTAFMEQVEKLSGSASKNVESITVIGGKDKNGAKEDAELTLSPGDVVCIVGATGSGKSRLLADIECFAQKDTPTGRTVLINGRKPTNDERFRFENKLVAQLSQNMNFVVDLCVEDFVAMHAASRMIPDIEKVTEAVITCANDLAGERFTPKTALTQLSGGQSRALMIADTALLSTSPIVLIDEIENAGVDRKKALELLVKKEKIVLMSTHDPILALLGNRRVAIACGGMSAVMETSQAERENLEFLEQIDSRMMSLRNSLRRGERIDFDLTSYFSLTQETAEK